MNDAHARTPNRTARRGLLAVVVLALGLTAGTLGCHAVLASDASPPAGAGDDGDAVGPGADDGSLPHGTTVFDEALPGIANLEPDLVDALVRATTDAADDGIDIEVSSGWRSAAHQNHLLERAIGEYGSAAEAARWVATAETSLHVSGEAVDVAPYDAIDWLSRFGAAYGLCQTYVNESWHFELVPEAADDRCPTPYPDPAHDPRMQQ